jgi:hypothetical protein
MVLSPYRENLISKLGFDTSCRYHHAGSESFGWPMIPISEFRRRGFLNKNTQEDIIPFGWVAFHCIWEKWSNLYLSILQKSITDLFAESRNEFSCGSEKILAIFCEFLMLSKYLQCELKPTQKKWKKGRQMNLCGKPQARSNFIIERIDKEIVLFNTENLEIMYLNQSAALIWSLMNEHYHTWTLMILLIETYPEAASEIRTDVIETMQRFLERDVIQFI